MSSDATRASSPQTPVCNQSGNTVTPPTDLGRYQAGIAEAYFEANDAEPSRTSRPRVLRAAAFALGGALAGGGIYYAYPALPGYEIGLVAVAAGWIAGRLAKPVAGGWHTRLSDRGS
jgi:hypothetical protein